MEVGTLKELGVKVGDVVRCTDPYLNFYDCKPFTISKVSCWGYQQSDGDNWAGTFPVWEVVQRASQSPTPKIWADMTDEEKGALLLAAHEGKVIEWSYGLPWITQNSTDTSIANWSDDRAYRISPEPKVETVTLSGGSTYNWEFEDAREGGQHNTHRITFNTIDGKPDCASIKMEVI